MFLAAAGAIVFFAGLYCYIKPGVAQGWIMEVHYSGLERVSGLAKGNDSTLFATQEFPREKGKLVRIEQTGVTTLLDGLSNPDGLLLLDRSFIISQERADGKLVMLDRTTRQARALAELDFAEGVALLQDGGIAVALDMPSGKLVRVGPEGNVSELIGGLSSPEGVCQAKDGAIYVAVKGSGEVLRLQDGKTTPLINGLTKPGYVFCQPDGTLWITEDRTNYGRLLHYSDGQISVVLSRLRAPQAVISDTKGGVYVAEQRRNRILHVVRKTTSH